MVDLTYAMSSFLQFRTVYDKNISFSEKLGIPRRMNLEFPEGREPIETAEQLYKHIKKFMEEKTANGRAALALSGGIDSAVCAGFMPRGSVAYTFQCVVPGRQVVDEVPKARQFCEINGLEHRVVPIYWEDYETLSTELFHFTHSPFHSIDIQIYKAALQAKKDGFDTLIFGQGADMVFGGLDKLLARDWTIGEFIERYSHVMPYKVLKHSVLITEPFEKFEENGYINVHDFLDDHLFWEDIHSYDNACQAAGVSFEGAYLGMIHKPLDLERVRSGDSKYLVREVFKKLYPEVKMAAKTPMPRPMDEWMENWNGPVRPEFWNNCHKSMTGDQKYYIWILEKFLEEMQL